MNKVLLSLISVLFFGAAGAQNIVSNPSFYMRNDTCPNEFHYCKFWYVPNLSTPDFFDTCNNGAPFLGIPINSLGYQHSPNAYIGVITHQEHGGWYEYAASNIPALTVGATYKVSLKISFGEKCEYKTVPPQVFFHKNITINNTTPARIPHTPQIDFSNLGVFSDTNWVLLSRDFIADSAYTHIIIGNFKTEALSNVTVHDPAGLAYNVAYYYIDSVSVEKMPTSHIPLLPSALTATVSPNPFTTQTQISFPNPLHQAHTLSVHNILGALVHRAEDIRTENVTIHRNNLPSGSYYYTLSRSDGEFQRGMFTIR